MNRVNIEECITRAGNMYYLVHLAVYCVREAAKKEENLGKEVSVVSILREIAAGALTPEMPAISENQSEFPLSEV